MRILDENNREIDFPGYRRGRLVPQRRLVCRHPAVREIPERYHFETVRLYPGGGRDVKKVVEQEAVQAREGWDEYEDFYRYVPYTPEQLALLCDQGADTDAMLVDHELRLTLLEQDGTEGGT